MLLDLTASTTIAESRFRSQWTDELLRQRTVRHAVAPEQVADLVDQLEDVILAESAVHHGGTEWIPIEYEPYFDDQDDLVVFLVTLKEVENVTATHLAFLNYLVPVDSLHERPSHGPWVLVAEFSLTDPDLYSRYLSDVENAGDTTFRLRTRGNPDAGRLGRADLRASFGHTLSKPSGRAGYYIRQLFIVDQNLHQVGETRAELGITAHPEVRRMLDELVQDGVVGWSWTIPRVPDQA